MGPKTPAALFPSSMSTFLSYPQYRCKNPSSLAHTPPSILVPSWQIGNRRNPQPLGITPMCPTLVLVGSPRRSLCQTSPHNEPNTATPPLSTPIVTSHPYQACPIAGKLEERVVRNPFRGFTSPEQSRKAIWQRITKVSPRHKFC